MQININAKIQDTFNKAADTYDDHCYLQKQICCNLITILKKIRSSFQRIVDFGCGTGVSTELLHMHIKYDYLYGIDFAKQLLDKAKINLKTHDVDLFCADFNKIIFSNSSIDLAFANMALQWSVNLDETLSILAQQLKNNALLAFSLPICGTFSELSPYHRNGFKKITDIVNTLYRANFNLISIEHEKFICHFTTWLEALKSTKLVGANSVIHPLKKCGLSSLQHIVKQTANYPHLTYNIAYIIAERGTRNNEN